MICYTRTGHVMLTLNKQTLTLTKMFLFLKNEEKNTNTNYVNEKNTWKNTRKISDYKQIHLHFVLLCR